MNKHEGYTEILPQEGNEPYDAIAAILSMVRSFLSAVGLIAIAVVVGLYLGGFFHFIAAKFPHGVVAFVLGSV